MNPAAVGIVWQKICLLLVCCSAHRACAFMPALHA